MFVSITEYVKINLKYTYNNVTTKLLKTNYQLVISKITYKNFKKVKKEKL